MLAARPMNTTNVPTVMERLYSLLYVQNSSMSMRLGLIILLAVLTHVTVTITRRVSQWFIAGSRATKNPLDFAMQQPKTITLLQLVTNAAIFAIYFLGIGLVLQELGVNLKGYLASASVIALAVSFGSQGLVQDLVTGLTLIFSNTMDIGDMVEIFGATSVIGRVEQIGLRFTVLRNFYNQIVFIPNRTIANVSRYPHGGVYAYTNIQIPEGANPERCVEAVSNAARGLWGQFGAIILAEPEFGPIETASGSGWNFVRVNFKVWPGHGTLLIETTFRQQVVSAMKVFNADYADWRVTVTYRTVTPSRPPSAVTSNKPTVGI
jgi:small-conductance mechanosensitive channel